MFGFLPTSLLAGLILFQTCIHIESLFFPMSSAHDELARPNIARRLRAPLMGRSLLSISPTDEDNEFIKHDSSAIVNSDEDPLYLLTKRRQGMPLFGRRWAPTKRRGPLFG